MFFGIELTEMMVEADNVRSTVEQTEELGRNAIGSGSGCRSGSGERRLPKSFMIRIRLQAGVVLKELG